MTQDTIGTTIHSDQWKAYRSVRNSSNCIHLTVNHLISFGEPTTGVYTQNIEHTWIKVKRKQKEHYY
jgi:hypothetical protein